MNRIYALLDKIRRQMNKRLSLLFFFHPVDEKKVMFFSSRGTYDCNPGCIADELVKDPSYKLIWVCKKKENLTDTDFPERVVPIEISTLRFYKEAMTSKVWVDNAAVIGYTMFYKKKEQRMIQTWHGSMGIKRFDTSKDKKWIRKMKKSASWTDYIISNSSFESGLYRNTFWKDTPILEYGHPRNDEFFDDEISQKKIKYAKEKLDLDDSYKYCLYAPTFRDDNDTNAYIKDYAGICEALKKRFGSEWKIIVRKHFMTGDIKRNETVIDASDYHDIQDLLLVCDAGLTDYSSWICDYALSGKPGFMHCSDYDAYTNERGFLFPLNRLPFPIARSEEELIGNILSFDEQKYKTDVNRYLKEMGCLEKGTASKKTAEKIKEICSNE